MSVEDGQCAAYVTKFTSDAVEIALSVVQGVVTVLSVFGSLLLILSHVILHPLRRSKSRVLIIHLAAASFLQAFPNFIAVFMDFRTRFKNPLDANNITAACIGTSQILDHNARVYCYLCVYQGFVSLIGTLSTVFWTVCICVHYFILVSCQNTKLASRLTHVYYVIAWLAPLGISLWLLFHNWLGFEPTYSTVNCGIRADCVPHHHPYHYSRNDTSYDADNWNRAIGVLFGLKIWQLLAFLTIPCLFFAIQYKNRRRMHVSNNIVYIKLTIPVYVQLKFVHNVHNLSVIMHTKLCLLIVLRPTCMHTSFNFIYMFCVYVHSYLLDIRPSLRKKIVNNTITSLLTA